MLSKMKRHMCTKKDLSVLLRPDKAGDEVVEPSSTVLETDVKPFN